MTETAIQWDREVAAHTRKLLRRLAAAIRRRQAKEAERNESRRATRKASRLAHEALTAAIEEDKGDDMAFAVHVDQVAHAAEQAKTAEEDSRRQWIAAVVARRKAQDELRVAVRRQFERLPLFDGPHANGQAPEPPAPDVIETNLGNVLETESDAGARQQSKPRRRRKERG